MKRFRVWGWSAALVAGFGGPAAAADPPAQPMQQTTLMNKLFGPKAPKPVGPTVATPPQRPITITAPLPQAVVQEALRAEQEAYLRRVSVCTELRRVAIERGDDSLARQADELERQSESLYNARVASLGVPRVKSPLPERADRPVPTPALLSFDEPPVVTSPLAAARQLEAPAAPLPVSTAGVVREVNP